MSGVLRPASTDVDLIRQLRERVERLESSSTVRVGPWVLANDESGALVATKPGDSSLAVGAAAVEPIIADLTRGFVTPEQVTKAITGDPGPLPVLQAYASDRWNDLVNAGDNIQHGVDGIVAGFRGALEGAFGQADATAAMTDTAATLAAVSAYIASGNPFLSPSGQKFDVDFAGQGDSTLLPAMFDETDNGSGTWAYGVAGGRLTTTINVLDSAREVIGVYNGGVTDTDNQVIGGVWTSPPQNWSGFGSNAHNELFGRSSADGSTRVCAEFQANKLAILSYNSGVPTVLDADTSFLFKTNTAYFFLTGKAAGSRIYQVFEGTNPVMTVTDSSAVTEIGPTRRGTGLAGYSYAFVTARAVAGDMLYWSGGDSSA